MSKELKEMLDSINSMKDEVKNLYAEGKDAEAQAKMDELEAAQAKFENLLKLDDDTVAPVPVGAVPMEEKMNDFYDSMRKKFRDMNEGTAADGGYTVPQDIDTSVNEFKKTLVDLGVLITTENVSAPTGARTYLTKARPETFATVAEAAAIQPGAEPKFKQLTYSVVKRGATFKVTEELLADSDANIKQILARWIAEADVRTTNSKILAALAALTPEAVTSLDGLKEIINVTLGQTYKKNSVIVTNDSGLNYLDTLKDTKGRYLLTPDISNPGQLRLSAGAISLPLFVVPDADLECPDTGSYPFFIGDFKEFMHKYVRAGYTIKQTQEATVGGVSAFQNDMVFFKVTERNDFQVIDDDSVVAAVLTPASENPT